MSTEPMHRSRRVVSKRLRASLVVAGLALIAASCGDRPLSTMDPESPIAGELDSLLFWLLIVSGIIFVLVQGAVIYMAMRFRVRTPDNPDDIYEDEIFPDQVHGNTSLEIGWTIVPTLIMAVVAFFTLSTLFGLEDVSGEDDPGRQIEKVVVVGHQWWWEFQYHLADSPDGVADIITSGELVLPVGEEIPLDVTSRDVIHSFWVPALNGKRDAVPGRTNTWTIETSTVGRFPGECTEFCGLSHAYMEKWAVGVTPADFAVWAANQRTDVDPSEYVTAAGTPAEDKTQAQLGWEVFNNNCASCHVINGLTMLGDPPDTEAGYAGSVDSAAMYDGANRLIPRDVLIAGAAPNLTHVASRSTFAGGIFELYENPDDTPYLDLAERGTLNRGQLEHWIVNAPEVKANAADELRGMPARALSDDEVDQVVAFLMTLD